MRNVLLHKLFRDKSDSRHRHILIRFVIACQLKVIRNDDAMTDIDIQFHLGPKLMRDAQQVKRPCIQRNVILPGRKASFIEPNETVLRILIIHIVDFHPVRLQCGMDQLAD
ncbi:hypothetical protein D3C77_451470 [compost metagenome]